MLRGQNLLSFCGFWQGVVGERVLGNGLSYAAKYDFEEGIDEGLRETEDVGFLLIASNEHGALGFAEVHLETLLGPVGVE